MSVYLPTIIGIISIILIITAFIIPKKIIEGEGDNAKQVLKTDLSLDRIIRFTIILIFMIFILYIIYCLNVGYYFIKNIIDNQYLDTYTLRQNAIKYNNPLCLYISWLLTIFILILSIVAIIMAYKNKNKDLSNQLVKNKVPSDS